ncbi:creatininase family protein [Kineococcus terrestris]|uniref:creatininase family protein n=1 Tax=Kineococcus terrestris TaxID=2044856 RepID=UPI0034DAFE01
MDLLTTATSADEKERAADIAVLPIGSFEQHGSHLPLITDTVIACTIAKAIADEYNLFLLPPITISCSHEHAAFAGTVSITASTLMSIIRDVAESLERQGIRKLLLVNGHGGNYVLGNVVQQSNVRGPRFMLYPSSAEWSAARRAAGCITDSHEDMHGGEGETSVLLCFAPHMVHENRREADWRVPSRPDLLTLGMRHYAPTGIIGRPSAASAEKGEVLVASLVNDAGPRIAALRGEVGHVAEGP